MNKYDHKKIEKKWQEKWEQNKLYRAEDFSNKTKYYCLVEFPYPSGDGLHVGHARSYTAMDILARKRRMEGYNVLYPIGWDAFGLPTENYAIKTGVHPKVVTKKNTDTYRKQLKSMGFSFDWEREINTTDPEYYKWTQWIFLQFYKKGLAYKKKMPINWCLSCKIGLANEEVVDGRCERCGGEVEKREKEQWMLAITKYADRLADDLEELDYLEKIKIEQKNWIGKSEGAEIQFSIKDKKDKIKVFTTRPDTLFGATYIVLAPEHPFVTDNLQQITNKEEVVRYIVQSKEKTEIERMAERKEKTGVELKAIKAINPANNEEIPIFIADYVLAHYGTGTIMAVPMHDDRDLQFALKFNLTLKPVIAEVNSVSEIVHGLTELKIKSARESGFATVGPGLLFNSGKFDGMDSEEAKKAITEFVDGEMKTTYKLRDWVFSRQRYWGEPIPIVHCEKCGVVPVPEKDLPVVLPEVKNYEPTETGESPLANITEWVNISCPKCKGEAKRETDTMPNWAGSSWYFLRYTDPKNKKSLADKKMLKYWGPVDWYNGGMEHTTLHLLYSRFWNKFLYDIEAVLSDEPYKKRTSHGMVLGEGGEKMSKSKGNVINPDDIVKIYGADTLRLYEMFMGPFDQPVAWSTESIIGPRRFLERIWKLKSKVQSIKSKAGYNTSRTILHKTIKKVSRDIETFDFNTAISQMMILVNEMERIENVNKGDFETFLRILSPFAPHITEEIWKQLGNKSSIHDESWPLHDESLLVDNSMMIAIQINGKLRDKMELPVDIDEETVKTAAMEREKVLKWTDGSEIKRIIYVPGKLVNIVV